MASSCWKILWINCMECHHLCMKLHYCKIRDSPIASLLMELLRPTWLVSIHQRVDNEERTTISLKFFDILHELEVYGIDLIAGTVENLHVSHAVVIWHRQQIACVFTRSNGIGLYNMATGMLQHRWRERCYDMLVHVSQLKLIVSV